jgi:hypothetical protein
MNKMQSRLTCANLNRESHYLLVKFSNNGVIKFLACIQARLLQNCRLIVRSICLQ